MECPKCQGGAYLADEELVKVMEGTKPQKAILKATFVCRSCGERFSRLVTDSLEKRRLEIKPLPPQVEVEREESTADDEIPEGMRIF